MENIEEFDDKDWSFTDCTSKVVMEQLSIKVAFALITTSTNLEQSKLCREGHLVADKDSNFLSSAES